MEYGGITTLSKIRIVCVFFQNKPRTFALFILNSYGKRGKDSGRYPGCRHSFAGAAVYGSGQLADKGRAVMGRDRSEWFR